MSYLTPWFQALIDAVICVASFMGTSSIKNPGTKVFIMEWIGE